MVEEWGGRGLRAWGRGTEGGALMGWGIEGAWYGEAWHGWGGARGRGIWGVVWTEWGMKGRGTGGVVWMGWGI